MKEKIRFSAISAGALIVIAEVLRTVLKMCYWGFNDWELFPGWDKIFFLFWVLVLGVSLMATAFTKWGKIPATVASLGIVPILLYQAFDMIQWVIDDVRYGGAINAVIDILDLGTTLFELAAFVMLVLILVVSLFKPDFKVLKFATFLPAGASLISTIILMLLWVMVFIRDGASGFFEWIISLCGWVHIFAYTQYSILMTIAFILLAISLRPKKNKEI